MVLVSVRFSRPLQDYSDFSCMDMIQKESWDLDNDLHHHSCLKVLVISIMIHSTNVLIRDEPKTSCIQFRIPFLSSLLSVILHVLATSQGLPVLVLWL
jgi:hypothetical protein